ncbi:hypothetical protein SARC_04674 [Sphaeroforma arctica JP610]|uniref:Uncharacterized protein n=1 Tax=Sphaeroforma arctica JP610 TaxID=667725 RepID=A0A0L0G2K1_9EUKA|nr:hypothetical protein SARC_04674 [Sphaeroforma arctica JP610]KNC83056.1 hypothetical protein SARC_04674 [Sphaeroforma arctica JP610]|eukprot:XP_014156958.1 hypothetical protein SARC_04674 [Sphaeroforma arctica JP610]
MSIGSTNIVVTEFGIRPSGISAPADLSAFSGLGKLEDLDVTSFTWFEGTLMNLPRLKRLSLNQHCSTWPNVFDMRAVSCLPQLTTLEIWAGDHDTTLHPLLGLSGLEHLTLKDLHARDWDVLGELVNLKSLVVRTTDDVDGIDFGKCTKLETLDVIQKRI